MNDLIRRKDAIDYFVTNIGVVDADGYAVDDYDERVKIWTERFSGIPSVEPERKHGEWIKEKENDVLCHCSTCGYKVASALSNLFYNFCPHCGADMRGEE